MITPMQNTYYYPNKLGRIILLSMEEVMGRVGLNAALNVANLSHFIDNFPPNNLEKAFPFEELSRMQGALVSLYGIQGGHGLALRSGRACFKYGLREFGPLYGCTDIAFRMQPLEDRIKNGAVILGRMFNEFTDQNVRIEDQLDRYLWHIDRCPICWNRQAKEPICHIAVGAIQEALYWVSGGKHYNVEETHCLAKGDASCTIAIDKKPLD